MAQGLAAGFLMGLGEGRVREAQIKQMKQQNELTKLQMESAKLKAEGQNMLMQQLGMTTPGQPGQVGPDGQQGQAGGGLIDMIVAGDPRAVMLGEQMGLPAVDVAKMNQGIIREFSDGRGGKFMGRVDPRSGAFLGAVGPSEMPPLQRQDITTSEGATNTTYINPYDQYGQGGGSAPSGGGLGQTPPKLGPGKGTGWGQAPDEVKTQLQSLVPGLAEKYGIDPKLLWGVVDTESGWNPNAVGKPTKYGTAKGAGQFIDSTWDQFGQGKSQFDGPANLEGTAAYLSTLNQQFGGDQDKVLGAYFGAASDKYVNRVKRGMSGYSPPQQGQGVQTAPPKIEEYTFQDDAGNKWTGFRNATTKEDTGKAPVLSEMKQMSGETAGKYAAAETALSEFDKFAGMFFDKKGQLKSQTVWGSNAPLVRNIGGMGEGRNALATAKRVMNGIFRPLTGAAMPENEVDQFFEAYVPKPLDDAETARDKLRGGKMYLQNFINSQRPDAPQSPVKKQTESQSFKDPAQVPDDEILKTLGLQ